MNTSTWQSVTGDVIARLPEYVVAARRIKETLLANLVMAGEIPAPTFGEHNRNRFLVDRFTECGLSSCALDEMDNGYGILPGKSGERRILVTAHADTAFDEHADHAIAVHPDQVVGPAISDNGLGIAALATLPTLLESLNISLDSDLVLMGSTRSLGRGNIEGVSFFLDNLKKPLSGAILLEGVQLGRLSHEALAMYRGEIRVELSDSFDWTRFGSQGAILTINEIINHINNIRLPRSPRVSIMFSRLRGGTTSTPVATKASLRFEIRSESDRMVQEVEDQIHDLVHEIASRTGNTIALNTIARRESGALGFTHPLTKSARTIMEALEVTPRQAPSVSELAAFVKREIPALTLGLTTGTSLNDEHERLQIEPMFVGMAQLIAILETMDKGAQDEH